MVEVSSRARWFGPREVLARPIRGAAATLTNQAVRLAGLGGLTLLGLVAVLLVMRHVSGALVQPLATGRLLALGCALAVGAITIRYCMLVVETGRAPPHTRSTAQWLPLLAPTVLIALTVWAVALPAPSPLGTIAIGGLLVVEEAASLGLIWRRCRRSPVRKSGDDTIRPQPAVEREAVPPAPATDDGKPLPGNVWQHIERARAADGRDECRGWLRASFAAHQRTEIVHLAFCPPFESTPDWTATAIEGPPLKIKAAQLLPYGVRLELRLDEMAREAAIVVVRFEAIQHRDNPSESG